MNILKLKMNLNGTFEKFIIFLCKRKSLKDILAQFLAFSKKMLHEKNPLNTGVESNKA